MDVRALLVLLVPLVPCLGCSGAMPATNPVAAAGPAPVAPEPARSCAAGEEQTLPAFVAPVGGSAFGAALLERRPGLACCLSGEALVRIRFEPDRNEDRARASLANPEGFAGHERRCLAEVLSTWAIRPAPRSDVCRRSWDPHGPACRFAPASVIVSLTVEPGGRVGSPRLPGADDRTP